MAKKNNFLWQSIFCSVIAGLLLTDCSKDDGYDLSDIDTTVGVSLTNFIIPSINSTMKIPLNDVFDIEGSDVISTDDNGQYIFEKVASTADVKPAHPQVDRITVAKQNGKSDYSINISALNSLGSLPSGVPDAVVDAAFDAVWGALPEQIVGEGQISVFNFETDVDDDVLWLDKIWSDRTGGMSAINVTLKLSDALTKVTNRIDTMSVTLPGFLALDIVTRCNHRIERTGDDLRLTLMDAPSEGVQLQLGIDSLINFKRTVTDPNNYLVIQPNPSTGKQHISLQGEAYMKLVIKKSSIEPQKNALKELMRSNAANKYQLLATTQLQSIIIAGAQGQFEPEIDLGNIGGVAINGLPDFLNGDNVRLVMANPQIYIRISSDMGLDGVITDVKLTGKGSRVDGGLRQVSVPDLVIARSENGTPKTTCFVIFDEGNENNLTVPDGWNLNDCEKIPLTGKVTVSDIHDQPLQIGRLASLVYEIPDSIKFSANGTTTTDDGRIDLGYRYTIQPEYIFTAPLTLNKGSYVIYNDSIDGWHDDLDDLKLHGKAEVEVTVGEVINEVPLSLTLNVSPKFTDNTPASIKSRVTTSVDKTIQGKATTNDLKIKLTVDDREAFEHLDGIKFEAVAESVDNSQTEALKKTGQTLKFNKIGAKVTGTFVVEDDDE